MANIALESVGKSLGNHEVLRELSLEVADGERLSLLGPSGCGKTTTLSLIAGFIHPDSGVIRVDGNRLDTTPPHKRNMGIVFQNYALFPHLTVSSNVAFGLEMRGTSKSQIAERVTESLRLVRLDGFAGRYPKQLSGGQQQRVALARALAIRPSVLLLDEPLSNLDTQLRSQVLDEIVEIQQATRVTTILVTHDHEEALAVSDRVAVMSAGRIEQIGTPTEIYHNPQNQFVAAFIGDSNFISGEVVLGGAEMLEFEFGRHRIRIRGQKTTVGPGTVLVRPEHIRVDVDKPHDSINSYAATVKTATYLGSSWRIQLVLDDVTLTASIPHDAAPRVAAGDQAWVSWAPENAKVLGG